jgi:hypothetical protein
LKSSDIADEEFQKEIELQRQDGNREQREASLSRPRTTQTFPASIDRAPPGRDERAATHRRGLDLGTHAAHIALIEQTLRASVAGSGTDTDCLRELRVGNAAIALQVAQDAPVDPVRPSA